MATFYIDPDYDSGGDGSELTPFDSWADVTWTAGNTYLQKRGTTFLGSVAPTTSGTAAARITISAYGSGALPIIQGGADQDALNMGRSGTRNYIDVSYLDLRGGTGTSRSGLFSQAGVATTVRENTVKNCRITAPNGAALAIRGDGWVIENNYIADSEIDGISGDFRNATIRFNTIINNDTGLTNGDGIQLFGTHDCGFVEIYNNLIDHPIASPKQGIILTCASGTARIFCNEVIGGTSAIAMEVPGGVCFSNEVHGATNGVSVLASGCVVMGNLIYDVAGGIIFTDTDGTAALICNNTFADVTLRAVYNAVGTVSWTATNNVFLRCAQALYAQDSITFASDYNDYFDCDTPFRINGTNYATLAAYSAATSQDANGLDSDPLLDASYRPTADSPCRNNATYIPGARHYGGKRMSVVSPTIGAHGYWAARSVADDRNVRVVG
jgi:hypothetical protein